MATRNLARARPSPSSQPKRKPNPNKPALRRRRTPQEAKMEALRSARAILLRVGPDAVTLQNVAADIGMSHSNLLHHFGTAGELQSALMAMMVRDLMEACDDAVAHLKSDAAAPRSLVDMVFDAFDKGGAGRLAAWMALTGTTQHLEPVASAIDGLVKAIEEKFASDEGDPHFGVTSAVLFLGLMALGDAVIGARLRSILGRNADATRDIAARLIPHFF